MDNLLAVAARFGPQGVITSIHPYGNGNINDTFLVSLATDDHARFILQRINTQVFLRPKLVMQNMRTVTEHFARTAPLELGRRWEMPRVLLTHDSADYWIDTDGSFWRALSFIRGAHSFDTVQDANHAHEVGAALGVFHRLISNLPVERLADTLEGFHITPRYIEHYDEVLAARAFTESPESAHCVRFVKERRAWASVLEVAKAQGRLPRRPIHGDPKVDNVMIDSLTDQAVSLIDLDTVKPGLVHYDIGDCLRSGCNPLGEEPDKWQDVYFETDLCRAILRGYLQEAQHFLTENDYEYLYDAIRLLAFELGLRFFTDHLEGNIYFKVRHAEHNLRKALVQFRLAESIESQKASICSILRDLR